MPGHLRLEIIETDVSVWIGLLLIRLSRCRVDGVHFSGRKPLVSPRRLIGNFAVQNGLNTTRVPYGVSKIHRYDSELWVFRVTPHHDQPWRHCSSLAAE